MADFRVTRGVVAAALLLAAGSVASPASAAAGPSAADKATARQLAESALADFDARRYEGAVEKMQRAQAIVRAPTHLLIIARSQAALGKLVEAAESYREMQRFELGASPPPPWTQAVADGERELGKLEPEIPRLRIVVSPEDTPDAALTIDGQSVPAAVIGIDRPIDPGAHRVRVSTPGGASAEATVTLARGQSRSVTLDLGASASETSAEPPPPSQGRADRAPRTHSGVRLRLGVGGGRLEDRFDVNLLGIPGLSVSSGRATGASAAFELAVGFQIGRPGLTLGGGIFVEQVASPKVTIDGAPGADVSVGTLAVVGPLLDWYPKATGGLHLEAALGLARIEIKDSAGNVSASQPIGGAGLLGVGYDLWIADDWSLGVLGRFLGGTLSADGVTHTVNVPSLLIVGTYR